MKVLVTGGTGFLGRQVVRLLLEEGLDVVCLVRPSGDANSLREFVGPSLWPRVELCRADLMQVETYAPAVAECDVVYHLAAALNGATSVLFLNTVVGTRKLIDACRQNGLKRFVLVSSIAVYGTHSLPHGALLDEECPLESSPHLRDPYTYSKVIQERVAWEAFLKHGLPLVTLRPGVIFGPGRGSLSSRVGLRLGGLQLRMGGRQQLPYTFVENCAAAVQLAGLAEGITGQAINIVDDDVPTGRQILNRYRESGRKVRTLAVPHWAISPLSGLYEWYHRYSQGQLPNVVTRYRSSALWKPLRYSNQKAKSLLGWNPWISFDEAFQRSLSS